MISIIQKFNNFVVQLRLTGFIIKRVDVGQNQEKRKIVSSAADEAPGDNFPYAAMTSHIFHEN